MKEIEHRWLVHADKGPELLINKDLSDVVHIEQHYLQYGVGTQIRVRKETKSSSTYSITTKVSTADSYTRQEFENRLSKEEYDELVTKSLGSVSKIRCIMPLNFLDRFTTGSVTPRPRPMLEIDIYPGKPFMIAELELKGFVLEHVELPDWLGEEVTGVREYSNAYLAGLQ